MFVKCPSSKRWIIMGSIWIKMVREMKINCQDLSPKGEILGKCQSPKHLNHNGSDVSQDGLTVENSLTSVVFEGEIFVKMLQIFEILDSRKYRYWLIWWTAFGSLPYFLSKSAWLFVYVRSDIYPDSRTSQPTLEKMAHTKEKETDLEKMANVK